MPRNQTILSIFVASPGDVSEERDRVDDIVHELNVAHARRTGFRLEVLRWERDVSSAAIREDAQAIITDQISQDYDVFLGIFWHKFGSPTKKAESGTEEEYRRAKERFEKDPESVRLMLYFKDAPPLSMDEFDADQFKKVIEFRSQVEKEVFYRKFGDTDSFANTIRIDLTKLIYEMATASGVTFGVTARPLGGIGEEAVEADNERRRKAISS